MIIFNSKEELKNQLSQINKNLSIGFVPTMGALHQGHLELIKRCSEENDITVSSIFVNPTQFNNQEDLEKYPRTFDKDIKLISPFCDILFHPSVSDIYPDNELGKFDFGYLENVLEGKFRPGHFNGVAVVVSRLFKSVMPDKAYFGEKDYQQLLIIKNLVQQLKYDIEIIPCKIVREDDGLAMSSRNLRMNYEERKLAPIIHQKLLEAKEMSKSRTLLETKTFVSNYFLNNNKFKLEYFEVVDANNLQPIYDITDKNNIIALIAIWLGDIRLIDNIKINF